MGWVCKSNLTLYNKVEEQMQSPPCVSWGFVFFLKRGMSFFTQNYSTDCNGDMCTE